jgi:hypothetical protein
MAAIAIAERDTARAVAIADSIGGHTFDHERAKIEIACKIGADRPDEAIKIIESMRTPITNDWKTEALGWLAVSVAKRDRARAYSMIDNSLKMTIDAPELFRGSAISGGAMGAAVRVASCAKAIGYPDMGSVIARVMAARPVQSLNDPREGFGAQVAAAIPLALLDPHAARNVVTWTEARGGYKPGRQSLERETWLIAWSLVDLAKADTLFEAELATLDEAKEVNLWSTGIFKMTRILATPPARRADAMNDVNLAGSWRPGDAF